MAIDKAIDSAVLEANLKAVADAIREKGGTSDTLAFPSGFADAIAAIEAGGGGVSMNTGTITPSAETSILTIEHGLGKVPTLFIVMVTPSFSGTSGKTVFTGYGINTNGAFSPDTVFQMKSGKNSITSAGIINYPELVKDATKVVMPGDFIAKRHTWIAAG